MTLFTGEEEMRLWSIHPAYLDKAGLGGCWRESLLAQKVLAGQTVGYKHHPQLHRFQHCHQMVSHYLWHIALEADRRSYNYDKSKISKQQLCRPLQPVPVTQKQLHYEIQLLQKKLDIRGHDKWSSPMSGIMSHPICHPCFYAIPGEIEQWEKI